MGNRSFAASDAQKTSLITAVVCMLLGMAFVIMTAALPQAAVGMPNAPKIFPFALGAVLLLLGAGLLVQQLAAIRGNTEETVNEHKPMFDIHSKQIALTVLNGAIYGMLFGRLGYVLSTCIFLGFELLLFSGKRRWKMIILVSVIFSLTIYILFNKLLGVYLPMMPVIGF